MLATIAYWTSLRFFIHSHTLLFFIFSSVWICQRKYNSHIAPLLRRVSTLPRRGSQYRHTLDPELSSLREHDSNHLFVECKFPLGVNVFLSVPFYHKYIYTRLERACSYMISFQKKLPEYFNF